MRSPVKIRSGTSGTEWIPFQLVTVLNSFGPVILSQVVSFLASGSAAIERGARLCWWETNPVRGATGLKASTWFHEAQKTARVVRVVVFQGDLIFACLLFWQSNNQVKCFNAVESLKAVSLASCMFDRSIGCPRLPRHTELGILVFSGLFEG